MNSWSGGLCAPERCAISLPPAVNVDRNGVPSEHQKATDGYAALGEFDENGDEQIDATDSIYARLLLWRRPLPFGPVQPADEHLSLSAAGISSIGLTVLESAKKDNWGNRFRYRSRLQVAGK